MGEAVTQVAVRNDDADRQLRLSRRFHRKFWAVLFAFPGAVFVQRQMSSAMRYWWVNQNQTYRQEIEGGYL